MRLIGLGSVLLIAALAAPVFGGEESVGLSVIGYGIARAKPTVVEISATISAEAELAADAGVKQRDARDKAIDALTKKNPAVSVESKGINVALAPESLAQQQMALRQAQQVIIQNGVVMQAGNAPAADFGRKFSVSEQLQVQIRDLNQMELPRIRETVVKTLDQARESGFQFWQPVSVNINGMPNPAPPAGPMILYRIFDSSSMRESAYKSAVEDAKTEAQRLAELSGVKLGRIVAVQEQDSPANSDVALSSTTLVELSVSAKLAVQFEIVR